MGAICGAIFRVKSESNHLVWLVTVLMALGIGAALRAQQASTGRANDFSTIEYFGPPHQTMVKTRTTGQQAEPLPGNRLVIRQLRLETFETNGVPGLIVLAPHCVYDYVHGVASSAGHLRLETADGSSHVEGDGFLWRQTNSFLTISNNVQTVIEAEPKGLTGS